MAFNSIQYFLFFAVVLAVYYQLDRRGQNVLMVVASSVFYGSFDHRFLALLWFSILVDFNIARRISATDVVRRRRHLFALSLVAQLGVLGFFKYFNFFSSSFERFLGGFGFEADFFTLNVVLPVGISFYTFQTLAYVFAVYKNEVEAERSLVTYAAFVSWFPQLVAGPIERAASLLPQVGRRRDAPEAAVVESGVVLILQGLFKKVVMADSLAPFVSEVYASPGDHSWNALLFATVGFAIQVYGDFSGYTDIARGSSRLLGVELRRNFEQPFLSRDIREFWRRWHISLSAWFVEFVSAPLGALRRGPLGSALVVVFMFTLIGLWHGAAWTFVFWGFLNGVLVAVWRQVPTPKSRHAMKLRLREAPEVAFTFALFCLGAVFFRAGSFGLAVDVLTGLFSLQGGSSGPSSGWLIPVMFVVMFVLDLAERQQRIRAIELLRVRAALGSVATPLEAVAESPIASARPALVGVTSGLMVVGLIVFSTNAPTPFIYFQF